MENFIKIGKDLGLEGDKLLQFAERRRLKPLSGKSGTRKESFGSLK